MTTIELVNMALLKIGESKGIEALDDESRAAWTGSLVYDHILRRNLRRFPWSFATKYADLYLVQGPVYADDSLVQAWSGTAAYAVGDVVQVASVNYRCILAHAVSHTPPNATYWEVDEQTEQANGDWVYAYRWPTDCLFGRRMVSPSLIGRRFDENPIPFRVGRDANGLLFYSNQPDANLEYTMIDCDHLWADDLWIDAFTWTLGAALAPAHSKIPNIEQRCIAMAEATFALAATVSSREQQQEKPGEAEWINGR